MAINRHEDIARELRDRIAGGFLAAGDRLPPETQLARQYGASVPTVRVALGALHDEGLIEKRHGRGNFVRRPLDRITYAGHLPSSTQRMATNLALQAHVITRDISANGALAGLLQVPVGAELTELVYQVRQEAAPHSLARIYVPRSVAVVQVPEVTRAFLGEDVRAQLAARGIHVSTVIESVTARLPSRAEAHVLALSRGAAVLDVERLAMDETGRVVEAACLVLPGHRSRAVFSRHNPFEGRAAEVNSP